MTRPQHRTHMNCDTLDARNIPPNATESHCGTGQVPEIPLDVGKSRKRRSAGRSTYGAAGCHELAQNPVEFKSIDDLITKNADMRALTTRDLARPKCRGT